MALYVQKFGGSSLGTVERIRNAASIIAKTRQAGHDVIVVVSAMQGETDRLLRLAHDTVNHIEPREYDVLLSTGEQVSAALLSMALNEIGCAACSLNASQIAIETYGPHKKSHINNINTDKLQQILSESKVPVVTGFQGVNEQGEITTIGRGGSDSSAVAIAAAVKSDECQIYTDVEGVYTTDPRVVRRARCLPKITFDEMLELSSLGAKVLHLHAVEFAVRHAVNVRVLSSFEVGPGTLITCEQQQPQEPQFSGIAFDRNQAKLTILGMPNQVNFADRILDTIRKAAIDVDMFVPNHGGKESQIDFSFTVHLDDYPQALSITDQLAREFKARDVIGNQRIAKLSLVGLGMKSHAGVASKMYEALGGEGINIHLITASEVKISAVIDEKYMELGARTLHSAFGLDTEQNN